MGLVVSGLESKGPNHRTPPLAIDEGIFPTQVGEAGEVSVGRAKGQVVLNGECSEVGVGYVVGT